MNSCDIAIIGSGPVGLEAAIHALQAGYTVRLLEQGSIAEHVSQWGHVLLFSPFEMNSSELGRNLLLEQNPELKLPEPQVYLTGHEYRERYLLPLSRLQELAPCLQEQTKVLSIGRQRYWKKDLVAPATRSRQPFRLLLEHQGEESFLEADYVLDCTGTYGTHNWLGNGGIPALGERDALVDSDYRLPDILNADLQKYLGKRTLVVGSGYSAATAVVNLEKIADFDPETKIEWVTRSPQTPPISEIENDPLGERSRITHMANLAATEENSVTTLHAGYTLQSLTRDQDGIYQVILEGLAKGQEQFTKELEVDQVLALVGYHPERRLYEELQVHECYATQGPIKLAASLLDETSGDCLKQSGAQGDLLVNPEPNFFILGAKSYGRDSRFLIQVGLKQIEEVIALIKADSTHKDSPHKEEPVG